MSNKKRYITNEEIAFLNELQNEMDTQDPVCQADPRFWVVRGTVKEYGIDGEYDCGGEELFNDDNECVASDMKEAFEYLKEKLSGLGISEDYIDNIIFDKGADRICLPETEEKDEVVLYDFEDVISFLSDNNIGEYRTINFRNVKKNFENTFFLTNKECKEHIRANYYHYPKDAHSYAMTAWRSPICEKLWKILQEVDFNNTKKVFRYSVKHRMGGIVYAENQEMAMQKIRSKYPNEDDILVWKWDNDEYNDSENKDVIECYGY